MSSIPCRVLFRGPPAHSRRVRQGEPSGHHHPRSMGSTERARPPQITSGRRKRRLRRSRTRLCLSTVRGSLARGARSPRKAVLARTRVVERHETGSCSPRAEEKDIIYYGCPVYGTRTYSGGTIHRLHVQCNRHCVHQNTEAWKDEAMKSVKGRGMHALEEQRTGTDGEIWRPGKVCEGENRM